MNVVKVTIPKDSAVLLLEDSPMRIAWFRKRIPNLTVVSTVKDFISYFDKRPTVDYMLLDHDLGEGNGTGEDAARWIKETFGGKGKWILIHSWNRDGARRMQDLIPGAPAIPFGEFDLEVEQ